ncbi:MAG TPA: helix-turn-helix transcriptional regulator [Tepidisphaeraceae bacterium]|nr:helix-turn-helix transcriptional regulator [Tepidisphaeraceae bacterium]
MRSVKKKAPRRRRAVDELSVQIHDSSGNVFADMGLPDADERLAKAELAHHICLLIKGAGLSQTQAAKRLGTDQPKVSSLMRGRLKEFSTERLMRFITALDQDVIITIRDPEDEARPSVRVLAAG